MRSFAAAASSAASSGHAMAIEDLLHPFVGSYLASPDWLKASAGRAYSMLPPRVRLGSAYETYREQIAATEGTAGATQLALRKLEATLAWALETVPAYHRYRALLQGRRDPREILEPIKRQLILSCDHLEERFMPAYAQALATHRPSFIEAFPSALFPLARWLAAHPLPEFTDSVKGVMLYSENVFDFQVRKFREVFQCPIVKHYGQSERVLMAASMPGDERYFFWPQYGWLELLDCAGRAVRRTGQLR